MSDSNVIDTDILIIGAGPVGLFTVFEAGLLGLKCHLVDNLDKVGGQCAELYPDKPIYDIPGVANQTAQEHVDALLKQIEPFDYQVHLQQRVESLEEITKTSEDQPNKWLATTNTGTQFRTANVFIAAGAGSFEPRKPTGFPTEHLEGKGVEFAVRNKASLAGKDIVIFGGGDSALDWTVDLAQAAASLTLVHRRDAFRGAPSTEAEMRQLVEDGIVQLKTPYVPAGVTEADGSLQSVQVKNFETDEIETLPCNAAIYLLGLHKKLGPILDWQLELHEDKKILVNTENFMSSVEGVFAIGDINHYPGKLDLILCGFHEGTLACQEAYRRLFPGERVPFGYTTSNRQIHQKLGVSPEAS